LHVDLFNRTKLKKQLKNKNEIEKTASSFHKLKTKILNNSLKRAITV